MNDTLYAREAAEEARSQNKMAEARLCVTCRWHKKTMAGHQCAYPLLPFIVKQNTLSRMITGTNGVESIQCETARRYADECGPEAKFWEPEP